MSIFGINLQPLKWKQFWKALKQKAAHIGASFRCLGLQLSVGRYGFPLFACWVQHLFSASSSRISYQSHDDLKEDTLWLLYSVCESSVTVGTQSSSQETWVPGPVSVSHLLSDLGEITFFLWNAVLSCYKTRPFSAPPNRTFCDSGNVCIRTIQQNSCKTHVLWSPGSDASVSVYKITHCNFI